MPVLRAFAAATTLVALSTVSLEGATVSIPAGTDLQAALNTAQPGDVLMLAAGATFTGNFILPVKAGTNVITIRSAGAAADLPGTGVRMTPAYASRLAKIQSTNN